MNWDQAQGNWQQLKGRVKDRLRVYGLYDRLGADSFHPTVGSVVRAYLAAYPDVEWRDWEDDPVPPESGPPESVPRETDPSADPTPP